MKGFFVDIFKSCRRHDLFNLSANISFFAILSLFPLTMIFISVLGYVLGSETIVTQVADSITDVVPGAQELFMSNVENLVKGKSTLGIWGLGVLLLVSTVLFSSLERALDKVFETETRRNFFHSRLLAIAVIFMIILFLFLPSMIRWLEAGIARYGWSVPISDYVSGDVFFILFAIFSYLAMIIIVPNRKVYFRYALLGGVLYAVGITVAKHLFRWYLLVSFDRYNLIYGSLSVLILTAVWIYYLITILLISSEIVAYFQIRKDQ